MADAAAQILTIEQGLREILASEGLTTILVGASVGPASAFQAQIHYDVPEQRPANIFGCSFGHGDTIDAAVEDALVNKDAQLRRCDAFVPELEAVAA